jgi:hypothetical protein
MCAVCYVGGKVMMSNTHVDACTHTHTHTHMYEFTLFVYIYSMWHQENVLSKF